MTVQLTDLHDFSQFKSFLTEYHKIAKATFNTPPLGINKALIVASRVFGYDTHHQFIHESQNKASNDETVSVPLFTITLTSFDEKGVLVDIITENFTDEKEMNDKLTEEFNSEVFNQNIKRAQLINEFYFKKYIGLENLDINDVLDVIRENYTGADMMASLGNLTFGYLRFEVRESEIHIKQKRSEQPQATTTAPLYSVFVDDAQKKLFDNVLKHVKGNDELALLLKGMATHFVESNQADVEFAIVEMLHGFSEAVFIESIKYGIFSDKKALLSKKPLEIIPFIYRLNDIDLIIEFTETLFGDDINFIVKEVVL